MTESDRQAFTDVMQALGATFGRECDEPMLLGYWMALADLPIENVKRATVRAIRECERMPTGKHLRRFAGVTDTDARSLLAWKATCDAVVALGPYKHVSFDDPTVNAVIRTLGGWPEFISRFSRDREEFIKRDFERAYQSLFEARVSGDIAKHLCGMSDGYIRNGQLMPPEVHEVVTGLDAPPQAPALPYKRPDLSMRRMDERLNQGDA